ncbi:Cytochrome [Forsythia ovata]|uniref:Cytochrome n=1 Tax=Forsythia ovata TaxID=205694 RepID=A0ABD1TPH9_9LAMI
MASFQRIYKKIHSGPRIFREYLKRYVSDLDFQVFQAFILGCPTIQSATHPREREMEKEVEQSNLKASKKVVVVESLGWITESSYYVQKASSHRGRQGHPPSSILELKAQLYKSQDESKCQSKEPIHSTYHQYGHHLEVHRAKKKIYVHDPFSQKNSGVDARASKDKLELKAVNDGSASYATLERKLELYNKRVRGELFRRGRQDIEHDEPQLPQGHDSDAHEARDEAGNYDDTLPDMKATGLGQVAAIVDKSEHKRFVIEVHEEVNQARENVSQLKIKQAYLRKQLEKLKALKTEQT